MILLFKVRDSWRMGEPYFKIGGKDMFFYRAVDKFGNAVDFIIIIIIKRG